MSDRKKRSTDLHLGRLLILAISLCLVNEFTLEALFGEQLIDLPGQHRNLLFYGPWCLRAIDSYLLVQLFWLFRTPRNQVEIWRRQLHQFILLFLSGLAVLLFSNPILAGRFMPFRLVALLILLLILLRVAHLAWVAAQGNVWIGQRLGLVILGLTTAFLLTEGAFFFVARSHHTLHAYASRIWFHRYWKTNELGYREETISEERLRGKQVILVAGDSFTAGAGVRKPADRFTNRLEKQLGDGFRVLNLGVNGLGPKGELECLEAFPYPGDVLIYAWFFNDIHDAAQASGMHLRDIMPSNAALRPTLYPYDLSYAGNYLWWLFPHAATDNHYFNFLQSAYNSAEVMQKHQTELQGLVQFAQKRQLRMAVILFPWLRDIAASRFATKPVATYFKEMNIPVLNLDKVLAPYPPNELIVNINDGHPNSFTHQLVADTLAAFLKNYQLID